MMDKEELTTQILIDSHPNYIKRKCMDLLLNESNVDIKQTCELLMIGIIKLDGLIYKMSSFYFIARYIYESCLDNIMEEVTNNDYYRFHAYKLISEGHYIQALTVLLFVMHNEELCSEGKTRA